MTYKEGIYRGGRRLAPEGNYTSRASERLVSVTQSNRLPFHWGRTSGAEYDSGGEGWQARR